MNLNMNLVANIKNRIIHVAKGCATLAKLQAIRVNRMLARVAHPFATVNLYSISSYQLVAVVNSPKYRPV